MSPGSVSRTSRSKNHMARKNSPPRTSRPPTIRTGTNASPGDISTNSTTAIHTSAPTATGSSNRPRLNPPALVRPPAHRRVEDNRRRVYDGREERPRHDQLQQRIARQRDHQDDPDDEDQDRRLDRSLRPPVDSPHLPVRVE